MHEAFFSQGLKKKMTTVCKCHGVSGACNVKVCWRKLPSFRLVGDHLREKLDGAVRMRYRREQKLRPVQGGRKASKRDLVFLKESPDYCVRNLS